MPPTHRHSLLALLALTALAGSARAEPMATSRFRDAPGPWLAPNGALTVALGSDAIRWQPAMHAGLGIGGVADIDVGYRGDLRLCELCDGDDEDTHQVHLLTSRLRVGGDLQRLVGAPLAGAIVFERSMASRPAGPEERDPAFAALSASLGVRGSTFLLGGGATLWAGGDQAEPMAAMLEAERVRPFGLIGWRPSGSKTLLLGELAYQPAFVGSEMRTDWVAGGGVRYLAFPWGASELAVRGHAGDRSFLMISVRFHGRTKVW